jgi:hypothetical protein
MESEFQTEREAERTSYRVSTGDVIRRALMEFFAREGCPVSTEPGPDTPIPRGYPGTPVPRPPVVSVLPGREERLEAERRRLMALANDDPAFGWDLKRVELQLASLEE